MKFIFISSSRLSLSLTHTRLLAYALAFELSELCIQEVNFVVTTLLNSSAILGCSNTPRKTVCVVDMTVFRLFSVASLQLSTMSLRHATECQEKERQKSGVRHYSKNTSTPSSRWKNNLNRSRTRLRQNFDVLDSQNRKRSWRKAGSRISADFQSSGVL